MSILKNRERKTFELTHTNQIGLKNEQDILESHIITQTFSKFLTSVRKFNFKIDLGQVEVEQHLSGENQYSLEVLWKSLRLDELQG